MAERLFSVILHGFIEYLDAVRDKSKRRDEAGDVRHPSTLFFFFSLMTLLVDFPREFITGDCVGE